ncbi:MAG: hypothetical protein HOH43_03835 [Candidatus Latescibacteria bacterium]|nr:hypothetical protein [Candidatus Latescibacterota bacterium]
MKKLMQYCSLVAVAILFLGTAPVGASDSGSDAQEQMISETVTEWAASWSNQDVNGYLSHYAPIFKAGSGKSMDAWQAIRRVRLTAPKFIEVTVRNIEVKSIGPSSASASFVQTYRSDRYSSESIKEMTLVEMDGRWQIVKELVHSEFTIASRLRQRDGFLLRWAERDHEESMGQAYDSVQSAIQESWTDIQVAYEQITRSNPMLFGKLTLQLTIDDGNTEVAFLEDSVGCEELRQMIREEVAAWNLDEISSASFNVSLPFKSTLRVSAR